MHDGIVVFCINDGTQARLQDPLELANRDVLLILEACCVTSPSCAISSAIYIGAVLRRYNICFTVVIKGGIASVLIDAMYLCTCLQQDADEKQQYIESFSHALKETQNEFYHFEHHADSNDD